MTTVGHRSITDRDGRPSLVGPSAARKTMIVRPLARHPPKHLRPTVVCMLSMNRVTGEGERSQARSRHDRVLPFPPLAPSTAFGRKATGTGLHPVHSPDGRAVAAIPRPVPSIRESPHEILLMFLPDIYPKPESQNRVRSQFAPDRAHLEPVLNLLSGRSTPSRPPAALSAKPIQLIRYRFGLPPCREPPGRGSLSEPKIQNRL